MSEKDIAKATTPSAPMMHVLYLELLDAKTVKVKDVSRDVVTLLLEADAIAARGTAKRAVRARNWVLVVISRAMRRIGVGRFGPR
jgi:hypothetical protein